VLNNVSLFLTKVICRLNAFYSVQILNPLDGLSVIFF
jgi:hypothetical protein